MTALRYDVYLMGPADGVDLPQLSAGMAQQFGALPQVFLDAIGKGPLRVKAGVDLQVAQQFVDAIRAAGGSVKLVAAGSPVPGVVSRQRLPTEAVPAASRTARSTSGERSITGRAWAAISAPIKRVASDELETAADRSIDHVAAAHAVVAAGLPNPFVVPRPLPPDHPLRHAQHQRQVPAVDVAEVAAVLRTELSLGMDAGRDLDAGGRVLAKQLGLSEPVCLAIESRDPEEADLGAGIALTQRCVAFGGGRVPFDRIDAVAVQCDEQDVPFIEIVAADHRLALPRVGGFATALAAQLFASSGASLWLSPRASRALWLATHLTLDQIAERSLAKGQAGSAARRALERIRDCHNLVAERHEHWEQWLLGRHASLRMVSIGALLDLALALEFVEVREQIEEHTAALAQEMLLAAQKVLGEQEGVLALFEFRPTEWRLPSNVAGDAAGVYLVTRFGPKLDLEVARKATKEAYLVGTYGVLTTGRLLGLRPDGSPALDVPLENVEEASAFTTDAGPELTVRYRSRLKERKQLRYLCSGNYLYPVAGAPVRQVARLARRIIEARDHVVARAEATTVAVALPDCPEWTDRALEAVEGGVVERMSHVAVELMRDPLTPREVRRLARLGHQIAAIDLRSMRQQLSDHGVSLGNVGQWVFFLPGELFEGEGEGVLITEGAVLVSGSGPGRADWGEIRRLERVEQGRYWAAMLGAVSGESVIRSRQYDHIHFLGVLIASMARAVQFSGPSATTPAG